MGLLKKIAAGVKDVAKAVSYVVAAPVNSATGHVYKPKYETPFGERVGAVLENSVDNVHAMGKSFADTLLGGLPSKLRNKIFAKSAPQGLGNYPEAVKDYGIKALNKLNQFSESLGSLFAASVGSAGNSDVANADTQQRKDNERFVGYGVIALIVLAVLYGLSRIFK